MAILNPGQLVLPELMWAMVRYITTAKSCSREQLLARISPDSLDAANGPQSTLRWLLDSDLLTEDSNGSLQLAGMFAASAPKTEGAFKRGVRGALLADANTVDLPNSSVQDRGLDLVRGLCWLLAQNPVTTAWTWVEAQTSGATDLNLGPSLDGFKGQMIVNDTRWNMFVHWAHYLGFAERWTIGRGKKASAGVSLVSSPARAVSDVVETLWQPGNDVAADEFCARIVDALPVLPSGRLANAVNGKTDSSKIHPALSYALIVGSASGLLEFSDKSDAGGAVLLDLGREDDRTFRRVSSVIIGKTKNG